MLFLLLKKQKILLYSKIITSENSVCLKFTNLSTFVLWINVINSFLEVTGYFYYENFDAIFYSSFYLKMDFRGVPVPNKFWNFSLRDLKQQMISPVGFVSINRKDYIIDLSKCLLLWRSWSSYFNIHKYPYNQLHLYNFCKLHLVKTLLYTVLILLQILKEDL